MSRIDDLIAELCPDGVEFVELRQLFNYRNGYTPSTVSYTHLTLPTKRIV